MHEKNIISKLREKLLSVTINHYQLSPEFGEITLNDSAVILPLLFVNKKLHVIFTERTLTVPTHKGQISFPGGRVEESDENFEKAALRETYEETGILPENVEILGKLSSYPTPSGYRIYPFIGYVSHFFPQLSIDEVHKIHTIPLYHLADKKNMEIKNWYSYGVNHELPFFYYEKCVIWGATGLILKDFIDNVRDIIE